ncbi:4-hydroxy-tetrahydrodipicolinate synthase [Candidatus Magnetominusculus xianensis]|uniref:4-hydroxy-tetrahydrodipicolinate synthase n=1 Tax=Candidatus Magnetominusculus xianensis TaxID=1748249 RepID=A0ABR5SKK9_9BACT|nr:4-hydroxy-tetrahydrodipicolinate synthase [Candidatus Magnetominusculus xianensis]KWT94635.1 4-hydroxy-tetrahydrodipicolinate synthase [Candidatus Magnetominusculus xianensis]MBF0403347.1 4-hydroxy-tetrahydrodipicolinate synthase [Nitrospirota bacterium]
MFKGSIVAIVTPFSNGRFDEKTYSELIEWHIQSGTSAIVPCGTTGESATLEYDEHYRVIEAAVKIVGGRVPVIAGTGANSTEETIKMTKEAKKLGADASLLVCPYYNKPTQEGIYRHYKAVAEAVDIPIVLYNVPGRTALNILPSTVARLSTIKSIVAIKEATGDMKQASEIIRLCGDAITVLSGDDFTTFPLMMLGGKGGISVTANVMPKESAQMCTLVEQGKIDEARKLHYYLDPLNAAMFIETNPIPVKSALAMMGRIKEEFRLPLCEMSEANKGKLKDVLSSYKLI